MKCWAASKSLVLFLSCPVSATTYLVRPDGTGDFPTIAAAIDTAVNGDIIELADGTFTGEGNRDLDYQGKVITIRSQSGDPELCAIDCEGAFGVNRRAFLFHSGEGSESVLEGVCIRNGHSAWEDRGAGILCVGGSSPHIAECWFHHNDADNTGGGIACRDGSSPSIVDCRFTGNNADVVGGSIHVYSTSVGIANCDFVGNMASMSAGGVYCAQGSVHLSDCSFSGNVSGGYTGRGAAIYGGNADVTAERCLFADNHVGTGELNWGGAVHLYNCTFALTECLFYRNRATEGGALFLQQYTRGTVTGCTFSHNTASVGSGIILSGYDQTLENAIIAFGEGGAGVHATSSSIRLRCCDVYGNAGGDWVGNIAGQFGLYDNISEDPMFCDPAAGDYHLDSNSPCAAPNNPECGQIGVLGIGCGGTAVMPATWGRIKAMYLQ